MPELRHALRTDRSPILTEGNDAASRYRAPALEKGLDIVELLASSASGMSLTSIASALGRSMGEIYRIALALEARGYIRRDPDSDHYALTLKLFELSHENPPTNRLLSIALPLMERLASRAQQSCHLAVLSGARVLIVAQADAPQPMHYAVRLGAQFPLAETSSGAVLFAYQPEHHRRALLDASTASFPELTETLPQRAQVVLANGGERRPSLVVTGVTNLSRPVFDHRGTIAAALTIPFLAQTGLAVDIDEAEWAVIATAAEISAALGWRDPRQATTEGEGACPEL
jgi:DNA-binding IclR family transcriptional regulator